MNDFLRFVSPAGDAAGAAGAIEAALACLDRFTAAFNACDTAGMDAQLQFPHLMLSGAELRLWDAPGQHPGDLFDALRKGGWASTRYESRDVVLASADKVHLLVAYTRRDAQGAVLSTHHNLWIVTQAAGRWGIALRSY